MQAANSKEQPEEPVALRASLIEMDHNTENSEKEMPRSKFGNIEWADDHSKGCASETSIGVSETEVTIDFNDSREIDIAEPSDDVTEEGSHLWHMLAKCMHLTISLLFFSVFVIGAASQSDGTEDTPFIVFFSLNAAVPIVFIIYYLCSFKVTGLHVLAMITAFWSIIYIVIAAMSLQQEKTDRFHEEGATQMQENAVIVMASIGFFSSMYHSVMADKFITQEQQAEKREREEGDERKTTERMKRRNSFGELGSMRPRRLSNDFSSNDFSTGEDMSPLKSRSRRSPTLRRRKSNDGDKEYTYSERRSRRQLMQESRQRSSRVRSSPYSRHRRRGSCNF